MRALRAAILVAGWLCVASVSLAAGPGLDAAYLGNNPPTAGLLKSGLLDLSRLVVSHSLSFASTSGTYGSQSGGLWVTRLGYRLSYPLRVAVDFGAVLDTSGDGAFLSERNVFLRGFELDYRPSKLFQLNVAYHNWPAQASPALGYSAFGSGSRPWGSPLGLTQ